MNLAQTTEDTAALERDIDERALVQRMLDGDEEAFEGFFEEHFPGLYRFTLARLKDPDLARDLVQTSICNAIDHLETYRGEAPLAAWLYTICRNEIRGHYKRTRREPKEIELLDEDQEVNSAAKAAGHLADPETVTNNKEMAGLVHAALDHLPSHYGNALEWKYLDGLSVKEIAERLRLAPKAAESLLTRARQAFKAVFTSATRAPLEGWLQETGKGATP